jgi:flagellar basal-body rod protein FlgF
MIRGLYTSALGMTSQMQKMDVVSNNIANIDNISYKRDIVVSQSFSDEMMNRLGDSGSLSNTKIGNIQPGVFIDRIVTDFTNGSLINTQSKLDNAIEGTGFFSIQVTDRNGNLSEQYTRDGSFTLGNDGTLITKTGDKVLGLEGEIIIPNGDITIKEDGSVYSNDVFIDYLKMVDFEDLSLLRKSENNLYTNEQNSQIQQFQGKIKQTFLENSNINAVSEMVEMINISRAYETNQRLVGIHDTILGKAVSEIGRR